MTTTTTNTAAAAANKSSTPPSSASSSSFSSLPRLRYDIGSTVVPGDRLGSMRQIRSGTGTYQRSGHIYASIVGTLNVVVHVVADHEKDDNKMQVDNDNDNDNNGPKFICSVTNNNNNNNNNNNDSNETTNSTLNTSTNSNTNVATNQVLDIGQRIVGRVLRITPQNAIVQICIAEHVGTLWNGYYNNNNNNNGSDNNNSTTVIIEGAIRMEDIRTGATDQIVLSDCFRIGDIVLARIISLGDSRRYFLSTAEPELGVIRAMNNNTTTTTTTSSSSSSIFTSMGIPMIPKSWKEMKCPITGITEPRKCAKPPTTTTNAVNANANAANQ